MGRQRAQGDIDGARLALDRFSDVFITLKLEKKEVIERFSDDMPKDRV